MSLLSSPNYSNDIILLFAVFTRVICSFEELSKYGLQNLIDWLDSVSRRIGNILVI